MSSAPLSSRSPQAWLPLVFMLAVLVLRVLTQHHIINGLPNFSPLMALAFAGTIVFPKPLPWWSWALLLLGVDLISENASWWPLTEGRPEVLLAYACYAGAAYWGSRLRGRAGVIDTLLGALTCSVIFYLVTNSVSWFTNPAYVKNISGWWQSLTIGTPGAPPTWMFFRNSLAADLAGSLLLLALYNAEAIFRRFAAIPLFASRSSTAQA